MKKIMAMLLAGVLMAIPVTASAATAGAVGSSVTFGTYEQDGNTANGAEPIEWTVIANDGSKMLLLSKYILDNQAYLHDYANVPWESSDLRSWMNGTFYNTAFDDAQKSKIITVTNSNPDSSAFFGGQGLAGGNDTSDNVFALSAYEAQAYLGASLADWNTNMQAKCTTYATMKGCWTHPSSGRGFWWLRTPGNAYGSWVATVQDHGGVVAHVGNNAGEGARPAIWVSVN